MPYPYQPGEVHDSRGVPIYPGDLLKSYHFTGARRKRHYLYHTAVLGPRGMELVPTSHLESTKISGGGRCDLHPRQVEFAEVILGYGPGDCLDHADRPRWSRHQVEDVLRTEWAKFGKDWDEMRKEEGEN